MAEVHTRCYRAGALVAEGFPLTEVSERLGDPDAVVWVDLVAPTADELAGLERELGLHQLAVEDAIEPHQRPKIDRYPTHLFLSCHAVQLDRPAARLERTEIDAFIGGSWVITVRATDAYPIDRIARRWQHDPALMAKGPGVLVYGLLDDIVDGYFQTVEDFDLYYDEVSESIFSERPLGPGEERRWFEMRRALSQFHRLVLPLREALSTLVRREHEIVHPDVLPYWQDLYDHVIVVSEETDALRDLASSLVDANLSLRDYRQNQVMKKVSSWAAIVAAPTLITGFYGMNVPFAGYGDRAGAWMSSLLIAGVSVALYALFRRREWL